ncbi:transcriptional regulator [Nocardia blacklockiae]|nr:transcriptional regulator [Nocardia blacklockiae]
MRAGLDPASDPGARGLRGADLRRCRDEHPLAAVLPLVTRLLLGGNAGTGLVVVVADRYGRALWVLGDPNHVAAMAESGLREGDDLSERGAGTNAAGLVVRTGRLAWVHGPEHYLGRLRAITAAAAPVREPGGRSAGVLMLAGAPRSARPELLALVEAAATAAELELELSAYRRRYGPELAEPVPDSERTRLRLAVLGQGQPRLTVSGERVAVSRRQAEILLLLAEHPAGLSAEHLALLLDDAALDNTSIRAAMSRLRAVIGPEAIESRPYRLRTAVATDVAALQTALDAAAVDAAVRLYAGPVLPRSAAPGVVDIRDEVRVRLRAAVLDSGDPEVLARWTAGADGRDDTAAWCAYRAVVARDCALYTQIEAKIRVLDRRAAAASAPARRAEG